MRRPRLIHRIHDFFLPHARNAYHPALLELAAVALIVGFVLLFQLAFIFHEKFVFPRPDFLASVLPGAVVALANADRAAESLSGLSENEKLGKAAQLMAEDMAAKGYFAHVSPEGREPWHWLREAGYAYSYAGQNLAVNFMDSEALQSAWMASPTHRANILNARYEDVGIGIASGMYQGRETMFVVQFFGTPRIAEAAPSRASSAAALQPESLPSVLGASTVVEPELSFFTRIVASPHTTLNAILVTLLVFFSVLLVFGSLLHMRFPHPNATVNCIALLIILGALILVNARGFSAPVLPDSSAVASAP